MDESLWLDMTVYPDTDPDTVLDAGTQAQLRDALVSGVGDVPDSLWEHLIDQATGGPVDDPDAAVETAEDEVPDDADPGSVDGVADAPEHDAVLADHSPDHGGHPPVDPGHLDPGHLDPGHLDQPDAADHPHDADTWTGVW